MGLGQPENGAANFLFAPGQALVSHRAQKPGRPEAGQLCRGAGIEDGGDVVVALEKRGGNSSVTGPLHRSAYDGGLVLARGHQDDPARRENGADAHGDRACRHAVKSLPVWSRVAACHVVEGNEPRPRPGGAAGFVETDVAAATDA